MHLSVLALLSKSRKLYTARISALSNVKETNVFAKQDEVKTFWGSNERVCFYDFKITNLYRTKTSKKKKVDETSSID